MKHEITSVPFAGGLNTKSDPKALKEGQLTTADNVIYQTAGIIRKRAGFTTLGNGTVFAKTLPVELGTAIANVNGELCVASNDTFYTYSELSRDWTVRGSLSKQNITRFNSINTNKAQLFTTAGMVNVSYADIGNFRCVAGQWNPYVPNKAEVLTLAQSKASYGLLGMWDKEKNEWLYPPTPLSFGVGTSPIFMPKVVTNGTFFYVAGFRGVASLTASQMQLVSTQFTPSTIDFTSFGDVPSMVVACYGGRDDAAAAGTEYGYFPDFTHGIDLAYDFTANQLWAIITGPAAPATGVSGGKLATTGTTGPTENRIAVISGSPGPFGPGITGIPTTSINGRLAIAAGTDQSILVTGYSDQVPRGIALSSLTTSISVFTLPFGNAAIDQSKYGGAYILSGMVFDDSLGAELVAAVTNQSFGLTLAPVPFETNGVCFFSVQTGTFAQSFSSSKYPWPYFGARIQPLSKPVAIPTLQSNGITGHTFNMWARASGNIDGMEQTNVLFDLNNFQTKAVTIFDDALPIATLGRAYYPSLSFMETQPTVLGAILPEQGVPATFELAIPTLLINTPSLVGDQAIFPKRTIVPLDVGAFITGARPSYYDGAVVRELGFDAFPEFRTATTFGTPVAGGNLGSTVPITYFYSGIFRYFDNAGKLVMSASFPTLVVASLAPTPAQVIQFYMDNMPLYKTDPIAATTAPGGSFVATYAAVIYRTTADDALNFRELGVFTTSPSVAAGRIVFQDNTPDSDLVRAGLPFLYSSPVGGELDNFPPPACSIAVASQQRIFVVSDERPNRVYYSKVFAATRAPEFTSFFIEVDPNSGPITGLGVIDTNLIVFKEKVIYAVTGAGPDATGEGNFNDPVVIWSDDGCINPNSVLVTAQGIFYQSARGIQLMDRSQQNNYIGAPVEAHTRNNNVMSGLIYPELNQVRFYMFDGTTLVYDYALDLWSRFTYAYGLYATSATLWNKRPTFLDRARAVIGWETPTTFTDGGSYTVVIDEAFVATLPPTVYSLTVETGWIKFAGLNTWNRLRRIAALGEFKTENSADLSLAYDYNPTYLDVVTFTTGTVTATVGNAYQWRARAPRQVMQSIRFKLVDTPVYTVVGDNSFDLSNSAESYNLAGLTLEWATKGGISRMPDNKSK